MNTSNTTPLFNLLHNDEIIFTGTENECYFKLQRVQGQSADWAIKYEGYKVQPALIRKTNSKEVKQAVQAYIMASIDFTSYEQESTLANVLKYYKSESGPLNGRTYQEHFIDFLQGLPSYLSIDFTYYDILQRMGSWGLPQPQHKNEVDSSNLYYYLIYREFCNLLKREGLSIY